MQFVGFEQVCCCTHMMTQLHALSSVSSSFTPSSAASRALTSSCMSEVQSVRLSRSSCMISVLSLYDSSPKVSSSAMASSNACLASVQARSGEFKIS